MKCMQCGAYFEDHLTSCPFCGAPAPRQQGYGMGFGAPSAPIYYRPMNWYKFLIYFALFAGAALNLFSAIGYFIGRNYEDPTLIYATFPAMRLLDITAGVYSLALSAYLLITRFALARMKRIGPKLLCLLYVISSCFVVLYSLTTMVITNNFAIENFISMALSLIVNISLLCANYVYFKNRSALFIC